MEGDSIKQAKEALLLAVDQLKATDNFNIIEFNSYAQSLWKLPKLAGSTNKEDAKLFVNSLSANGGTEMETALKLALELPKINEPTILRQIVFITDGSVANEESLMTLISHKLKNSRLFTVGIGSAPNSYFMSEAAKMGRGTFTYIGSVAQVQEKMLALLTKIQHPAITDIELQLNASTLQSNRQLEFYPNVISDLYKGEPLILSYRLTDGRIASSTPNNLGSSSNYLSKVNLSAKYQGKPWENALELNSHTRQSGLNILWAREKISQLTRDKRRASMRTNSSAAEQDEYKSLITETALTHHLISQYTSLVAVDVTPTRPAEKHSNGLKIENILPKGTSNKLPESQGHLPQTATVAQLKIIIGLILIGLAICMHLLTKRKAVFQNYYP
jgi:Ca-activated chloride channel family protein